MPKFCTECGTAVGEGDKFCPGCRRELRAPVEGMASPTATPMKTIEKASATPAKTSRKKAVLIVFAALFLIGVLAWFIGHSTPPPPTLKTTTIKGAVIVLSKTFGNDSALAIRRVPKAIVTLMRPDARGWNTVGKSWTADSNGDFSLWVPRDAMVYEGPIFVAASDQGGTFTLLATIPADFIKADVDIEVGVTEATTLAALMHCPGGVYPPPRGGYCYSDPEESTHQKALYKTISSFLITNQLKYGALTPLTVDSYLRDALQDPDVLNTYNQILDANSIPPTTADLVLGQRLSSGETGKLPIITSTPATITPAPATPRPT